MGNYILKRILWFVPTFFIITLLGFIITTSAPGNPVDTILKVADQNPEGNITNTNAQVQRKYWRHKLGLDLPVFYFSLSPLSCPDTLYKIENDAERNALKKLSYQYGNWSAIAAYYTTLKEWYNASYSIMQSTPDAYEQLTEYRHQLYILPTIHNMDIIEQRLNLIAGNHTTGSGFEAFSQYLENTRKNLQDIKKSSASIRRFIPSVHFYGQNQYHRWLFGDGNTITGKGSVYSRGLIRGDFGISFAYMEPVSAIIGRRIGWTLFFTFISVLLGYLVSIPLGLKAAEKRGSRFDRVSTVFLFILYSVPAFFMATLLQYFLSSPYGFELFETTGVKPTKGYPEDATLLDKIRITLPFLVLPVITYSYSAFAFITRTVRTSALEIRSMDFIRTAKAKGLSESQISRKHVLRNALLPLITIFTAVFPVALGGSVILEYIFGIPGMGLESYAAISRMDYPVIIAVFTLSSILTLAGFLLADILYVIADPRISYTSNE